MRGPTFLGRSLRLWAYEGPAGAPSDSGSDADRAERRGRGLRLAALGGLVLLAGACCAAVRGHFSGPKPLPPAAAPRGQLAVEGMLPTGSSEEVEATLRAQEGGTCLLSIAVGQPYVEAAKVAGRTKAAYAKKAGYRNLFFYFDDPHQFNEWCRSTELGSKFQWEDSQWTHSTLLKYCAVSAAINENGCEKVLFSDADALIVNFDIAVGFDWPGASHSQQDGPHSLWAFATWPEGFDKDWKPNVDVVPRDSDWCTGSAGSCGTYAKFASCLNTGVFVMDNSQPSKDFVHQVMRTLLEITQDGCSTGQLNPWGLDQCKLSHGDQCIAACSIRHAPGVNADLDDNDVPLPEDFMCLDTMARPRLQETYQLNHDYPDPHSDTFIVNCIGDEKVKCINTVMAKFPHLAEFADDDW